MTRWYGNLINRLTENSKNPELPKPGDGATVYHYSDRTPATVSRVEAPEGKAATVYIRTDDFTVDMETEGYAKTITPNPANPEFAVRLTPKGWKMAVKSASGRWSWRNGESVRFGVRDAFYDRSF